MHSKSIRNISFISLIAVIFGTFSPSAFATDTSLQSVVIPAEANTVSVTGTIVVADGTPVQNATISFENSNYNNPVWTTFYTNNRGEFTADLVPGNWTWVITGFDPATPVLDIPITTDRMSNPKLPWRMYFGSNLIVDGSPDQNLSVVLPVREVELSVRDNLGNPLPGAHVLYSPSNSLPCTNSFAPKHEFSELCLRTNTTDAFGKITLAVYNEECNLCRDGWWVSRAWENVNAPARYAVELASPNEASLSEHSEGTLIVSSPEHPAWLATSSVEDLSTSALIELPDPILIKGKMLFGNEGIGPTESPVGNGFARFFTKQTGLANPTTVFTTDNGDYSFLSSPELEGYFQVGLTNPDTDLPKENSSIEEQILGHQFIVTSSMDSEFKNSLFQSASFDTDEIQTYNWTIPSYRKVKIHVTDYATGEGLAGGIITTGQDLSFCASWPILDSLCNRALTQETLDKNGDGFFYSMNLQDGSPNIEKWKLSVRDPENDSRQVPSNCPVMNLNYPYQCHFWATNSLEFYRYNVTEDSVYPIRDSAFSYTNNEVLFNFLLPKPLVVKGKVESQDGTPFEGVNVLLGNSNQVPTKATTDSNGEYTALVDPTSQLYTYNPVCREISLQGYESKKIGYTWQEQYTAITSQSDPILPNGFYLPSSTQKDLYGGSNALCRNEFLPGQNLDFVLPNFVQVELKVVDPLLDFAGVQGAEIRGENQFFCDDNPGSGFIKGLTGTLFASLQGFGFSDTFDGTMSGQGGVGICGSEAISSRTDSDGIARFSLIPRASSWLSIYEAIVYDPVNPGRQTRVMLDGNINQSITVQLPSPPQAPESISISESSNGESAEIIIASPPDLSEDAPILGYYVEALPIESDSTVTPNSLDFQSTYSNLGRTSTNVISKTSSLKVSASFTPQEVQQGIQITGLDSSQSYAFLVRAWNSAGVGDARATSNYPIGGGGTGGGGTVPNVNPIEKLPIQSPPVLTKKLGSLQILRISKSTKSINIKVLNLREGRVSVAITDKFKKVVREYRATLSKKDILAPMKLGKLRLGRYVVWVKDRNDKLKKFVIKLSKSIS